MAPRLDEGSGMGVFGDNERGLWSADVSGWGVEGMRKAGGKVVAALGILGDIFAMLIDAVWSTVGAIVHRRFSWAGVLRTEPGS